MGSMFVHLEGRTKEDAFKIGQEIAAAVTAMNPTPVTLKMEKVYHPCVLLTKKRYVGYSFESPGQLKPIFDAKGIETVRRDSCAAVAKTLERSLRILFETQDLSQVALQVLPLVQVGMLDCGYVYLCLDCLNSNVFYRHWQCTETQFVTRIGSVYVTLDFLIGGKFIGPLESCSMCVSSFCTLSSW
jgi:hypothetical protein